MANKFRCKNVLKLFVEKIRNSSILNSVPKWGFCNTQHASILSSFHKACVIVFPPLLSQAFLNIHVPDYHFNHLSFEIFHRFCIIIL